MPDLWPEVAWVLTAFGELTLDRPVGFGSIGYITTPAIVAWAVVNEVDDVPCFLRHIRALDREYVADQIEKQKRDAESRRQNERGEDHGGRAP
jgi:hypothetical protein